MLLIGEKTGREGEEFGSFVETLRANSDFFSWHDDVFVTRAPGRLDVMGGIADYSGSRVLEMPIAEAAFAAVQKIDTRQIRIKSLGYHISGRAHEFSMPLDDLLTGGEAGSFAGARDYFRCDPIDSWAAYIAGSFVVLINEKSVEFDTGAAILIDSNVPAGKGVSSSAAIEVAAMMAIAAAFEIEIAPRELAILCQKVENLVVGAPCGIMDQTTSAIGEAGQLFSMVCQPAEAFESIAIPDEIAFWGIDSGIRHSVGGDDYGSVRTGAFIGYRIIAEEAGLTVNHLAEGIVEIDDPKWNGYLANIQPLQFERDFAARLPHAISGKEFLSRYRGITDRVTSISAEKTYAVFCPTKHPIYENQRVNDFADNLMSPKADIEKLGDLMYASHESYSACGLGSGGTDLLVNLVLSSPNLFGAKITGGGSGGTVAVLGRKGSDSEIKRVAAEYEKQTGHRPYIFSGSSIGALKFGHRKFRFGRGL